MATAEQEILAPVPGGFNMRFVPVQGSRYSAAQAAVLGPALLAISRGSDEANFQDIVDAAEDPESPFHAHITWDEDECVRKQRLSDARHIARSIELMYDFEVEDVVETRRVRAFHPIEYLVVEEVAIGDDEVVGSAIPGTPSAGDVRGGNNGTVRKRVLRDLAQIAADPEASEQLLEEVRNYLLSAHEKMQRYNDSIPGFAGNFPASLRRELSRFFNKQVRDGS